MFFGAIFFAIFFHLGESLVNERRREIYHASSDNPRSKAHSGTADRKLETGTFKDEINGKGIDLVNAVIDDARRPRDGRIYISQEEARRNQYLEELKKSATTVIECPPEEEIDENCVSVCCKSPEVKAPTSFEGKVGYGSPFGRSPRPRSYPRPYGRSNVRTTGARSNWRGRRSVYPIAAIHKRIVDGTICDYKLKCHWVGFKWTRRYTCYYLKICTSCG